MFYLCSSSYILGFLSSSVKVSSQAYIVFQLNSSGSHCYPEKFFFLGFKATTHSYQLHREIAQALLCNQVNSFCLSHT